MKDAIQYTRYESPELQKWKQLPQLMQLEKIESLSQDFRNELKVINVKDQMIEVNVYVPKEQVYQLLVNYEKYLREKLDNMPIIVLLKERLDENKKRK